MRDRVRESYEVHKRRAFESEAVPHMDAVHRFALRLTDGRADEAADLVQETFLRAYRSWERYIPGTNARSWLFTICRNVFSNERRRQRREQGVLRLDAPLRERDESGAELRVAAIASDAWSDDPELAFFDSLVDDRVAAAVSHLPPDYRHVLELSDVEELSYEEIATQLGIPIGTVRSRLFRARRLLRAALAPYAKEAGYDFAALSA